MTLLFSNMSLYELFSNYGNSYFSFKLIYNFQTRKFHLKLEKIQTARNCI